MSTPELDAAWEALEAWLAVNAPEIHDSLRPGAALSDLASLEDSLGVALPVDVRHSLLRHDGQDGPPFLGEHELFSVDGIRASWESLRASLSEGAFEGAVAEAGPGVRSAWFHPRWVPLTRSGRGDALCVDTAPAAGGVIGQILAWIHDSPFRTVRASSWTELLAARGEVLASGAEVYSEMYGMFVARELEAPGAKLEVAAAGGDLVEIDRLLAEGADPHHVSATGPLLFLTIQSAHADVAVQSGHADVVARLLDAGVPIEQPGPLNAFVPPGSQEVTPLEAAAWGGHLAIVALIHSRSGSIRPSTLHVAVHGGPEVVRWLLDRGAQGMIEARDELGRTPLIVAAQDLFEPQPVLEVLLEAGADRDARDAAGRTAAEVAFAPEVAAFLRAT